MRDILTWKMYGVELKYQKSIEVYTYTGVSLDKRQNTRMEKCTTNTSRSLSKPSW